MKWVRVANDQWVLLCVDRAEVASVRRIKQGDYMMVSLTGALRFYEQLGAAKREGSALWRRAERMYQAALHSQRNQR